MRRYRQTSRQSLPAVPPKQKRRQRRPARGQDASRDEMAPVIPQDRAREGGVEHARDVIFESEIGQEGDTVLLADEQEQGEEEHVAESANAGGARGAGEAGDGQANAHRADEGSAERQPEEGLEQYLGAIGARQQGRQGQGNGGIEEKARRQDLAWRGGRQ